VQSRPAQALDLGRFSTRFSPELCVTEEQFLALISVGRETESLEAKPGGARSDQFLAARVVRAALGMANHEGGGWIVIGIEEEPDGTFDLVGVPEANLAGWNHDDVSAMINGCAQPHIAVETSHVQTDGRGFVVVRLQEFIDVPVICKAQGPTPPGDRQIYRKDVCYARSRRKPETIEAMSDATTWRTLIDLAGNKAATRALKLVGVQAPAAAAQERDAERFAAQLGDLA
jgi:predicted HTH transcriptional regulator